MTLIRKILIFCAVATFTALIACTIRHSGSWFALLTFYGPQLIPPFVLLAIPRRNRVAIIMQKVLLIAPIGIALGCWLMCMAPTGTADGELMGWAILTALWAVVTTPICIIPLLLKTHPPIPTMNNLTFRKATPFDLPTLRRLYNDVIDGMEGAASHAQWHRGGYPTDAFLQSRAALGELWVAEMGKDMVAAMILNAECNPGYAQANWQVKCKPHEVMAIHTLGVSPSVQGQGVGKAMVQKAIEIAREKGCKSMRLDVIDTNPAACDFYARLGFISHGVYELDYPGAVCTNFTLCELPLV